MALLRFVQRVVVRMSAVLLSAVEEHVSAKGAENRSDSANMIAMWMRQENRINVMNALAYEERHNDFLTDRFGHRRAVARLVAFEPTSGVNHDCMSARGLNEDRVGLPDVDEGDA